MAELVNETIPKPGSTLPKVGSHIEASSTLPSSRSYAVWAASCPETNFDFGKRIGVARAKHCAFCGDPIRLSPRGDQSLIEHMKSNLCKSIQQELEHEIASAANSKARRTEPGATASSSSRPSIHLPSTAASSHNPRTATFPCQGAELKLPRSSWSHYPWHLHDPNSKLGRTPSFYPCSINHAGDIMRIRSRGCLGILVGDKHQSCIPCSEAVDSREVKSIVHRMEADMPANGLNLAYYSHKQLRDALDATEEKLKNHRLRLLEQSRMVAGGRQAGFAQAPVNAPKRPLEESTTTNEDPASKDSESITASEFISKRARKVGE
ncbi:unnamed protein product [Rhizoctonia solani]|uniref:Uncharacterized protein n=1 Tax=Rhizoctonia solani TaxID=456999 RepID=A0A8H3E7G2_9AGAM|nr:unnamed protein product [Rhizoctonia solani]